LVEHTGQQADTKSGTEAEQGSAHSSAPAAAKPINMPANPVSPVSGGAASGL